jgi:RNA polymerase sigma-70 factor, ECF subfamily
VEPCHVVDGRLGGPNTPFCEDFGSPLGLFSSQKCFGHRSSGGSGRCSPVSLSSCRDGIHGILLSERVSDADIARGVVAGERDALEAVFNQTGGAIKALARRIVRNEALAEDVVQETFLAYWRSPESYQADKGSLRTYLLTIAHRRAVDIVRSEQARSRRELIPPDPDHSSLEDEVIARTVSEEVRLALTELSTEERQAISMAYLGGFSYVEAARRLGTPEGTVKSRIRSGMKKLASSLEGIAS